MTFPSVSRGPQDNHVLVWVTAKNRSTGAAETMGLWTGLDARSFTVDGAARDYFGAGAVLDLPAIQSRAGMSVQMQTIGLNILTPEVTQLVRTYDVRQAPIEVHLARFDPEGVALLDLTRIFTGWVDEVTIQNGPKGGTDSLTARLASSARALTDAKPVRISDADHQRAESGDRLFRYADVSGSVAIYWGLERSE